MIPSMSVEFISLHVRTADAEAVRESVTTLFEEHGFSLSDDAPAQEFLEGDAEDGYGVFVSAGAGSGWTSVYVADWEDSGLLGKHLSLDVPAPTLELWTSNGLLWGYTCFERGAVVDRFASVPNLVAADPAEEVLYAGDAAGLARVLHTSSPADALLLARADPDRFAGIAIDRFCASLALPFTHAFAGYDDFFDDDPEDFGPGLEDWQEWRHLTFTHPAGRDTLTE